MSAARFEGAYAPRGTIALQQLRTEPGPGDSVHCRATLTVGQQPLHLEASAFGAIGAMSEMLYGLGAGVEIVSLYHQRDGRQVAAYLRCERDGRQCWAYGLADTGDEATVRALISAANQLHRQSA
ncbi:hypothetical protein [Gordonia hirsuta]|nr:hypothetical protein [Gordonia hirsuta]